MEIATITPTQITERGLKALKGEDREAAQQALTLHNGAERIGQAGGAIVAGRTYGLYAVGPVAAPYLGGAIAFALDFFGIGGDGLFMTGAKEAAYSAACTQLGIDQAIAAGRVAKL